VLRVLLLLVFTLYSCAHQSVSDNLVPWGSAESQGRFDRSIRVDFFALSNQFESQINKFYCGPASASIVLNALRIQTSKVPKPQDLTLYTGSKKFLPTPHFNPVYERYTQNQFFNKKTDIIKTKAQVFGEQKDYGLQLDQYAKMLNAHELKVTARFADSTISDAKIRQEIIENLNTPGNFVIVNYNRKDLGQSGSGHISPLAAYDPVTDSFLILDVAAATYPWAWAPGDKLIAAMRTLDVAKNRGYLLISD
jgi:hypothetical protein